MASEKLKAGFLWTIVTIAVLIHGPYLLGGIYAVAALPVFSAVCGPSGNPLMFVREPINYPDYQTFLYGEGCKLPPPAFNPTVIASGATPEDERNSGVGDGGKRSRNFLTARPRNPT